MSASFLSPTQLDAGTARFADDAALSKAVGASGFNPCLVPAEFGGALPKVEALSICVLRDALAYRNAAADLRRRRTYVGCE